MDEITQSYAENVKIKRFYMVINNSYTVICCSTADKKKQEANRGYFLTVCAQNVRRSLWLSYCYVDPTKSRLSCPCAPLPLTWLHLQASGQLGWHAGWQLIENMVWEND